MASAWSASLYNWGQGRPLKPKAF